jgi:hypothetical protein
MVSPHIEHRSNSLLGLIFVRISAYSCNLCGTQTTSDLAFTLCTCSISVAALVVCIAYTYETNVGDG